MFLPGSMTLVHGDYLDLVNLVPVDIGKKEWRIMQFMLLMTIGKKVLQ